MKIVILAGGAGTRLWPMSTKERPKQFQKLVSDKTMLQETLDRVRFVSIEDIYVSTNAEYLHLVKEQLPEIAEDHIIAEPSMQDTGPCIGLAAALIAKENPEAVMAVVYADHLVQDEEEFKHKLEVTAEIARKEKSLNIIEVKAKAPNTNLGYVRIGKQIEEIDGVPVYEFKEFKEKPDLETAKRFMASHHYLWNTGYYVWRVDVILQAFKDHLPNTHNTLLKIQEGGNMETLYPQCEKISIDYGIMEKVSPEQVRIIAADLGWNDIGTWASLHEELASESRGNVTKGKVTALDCKGCLIYNETEQEIAVSGLRDMVIVKTKDADLACSMKASMELKSLLKLRNGSN